MISLVFCSGYVEALVIPAESRNIIIQEASGSPNYLALRSASGDFYLNGNWYIKWSGVYDVAGASGQYSRRHNRDTFKTKGPITEDLHVLVSVLTVLHFFGHFFLSSSPLSNFRYSLLISTFLLFFAGFFLNKIHIHLLCSFFTKARTRDLTFSMMLKRMERRNPDTFAGNIVTGHPALSLAGKVAFLL